MRSVYSRTISFLIMLIAAVSAGSVCRAAESCDDIKLMRPKIDSVKSVPAGLQYDLSVEVFNRTKAAIGPVTLRAGGAAIVEGGTIDIKELKSKDTMKAELYAVAAKSKARHGQLLSIEISASAAGCETIDTVTAYYYDDSGTMYFIPGFHCDPEWWNTQQRYLENYTEHNGEGKGGDFKIINAYLDSLAKDPDYRFMLAEQDYLKPFTIAYPERVPELRKYMKEGRFELGGISYNEPQTTLISTESSIRNALLGIDFFNEAFGTYGKYAWQLDVFGHSPLYPMIMEGVGAEANAWARGPYHEWAIDRDKNHFPSEFFWVSPDGTELFTHFMSGHYSYGSFKLSPFRGGGYDNIRKVADDLIRTSITGHMMVPMVDDFVGPIDNLGDMFRKWNGLGEKPSAVIATPGMFFDAAKKRIEQNKLHPPRISRDMNPVFPGCAISFTDTKQANRAGENTLTSAEKFGTVAWLLDRDYRYPREAIEKAWRQLSFLAHHDGITGSMSDQVYLDLLGSWREVNELAGAALMDSLQTISAHVNTRPPAKLKNAKPVVLFNPLSWTREDIALVEVESAKSIAVFDSAGKPVVSQLVPPAAQCSNGAKCTERIAFKARIPATGYAVFYLAKSKAGVAVTPERAEYDSGEVSVSSADYTASFDLAKGGAMTSLKGAAAREFVPKGALANEIVVYHEYPTLPGKGEGPWHLNPTGRKEFSRERPARLTVEKGPVFTRVTVYDKGEIKPGEEENAEPKFELLEKESRNIRDASNFKARTYDLSKFIGADGKVFVRFSDSFTNDGWGALAGKVKFTADSKSKPAKVEFTPAKDGEDNALFMDGGSNVDPAGRRFSDGNSYWIYKFEADPGATAKLEIELGNQFVVEAADKYSISSTEYQRAQEAYFYEGMERIDFRTFIHGYKGKDKMFRVYFPLDAGGKAVPVYEIGNATVGRNFGLDVDTAKKSWTLGNTAYNWAGISHVFFLEGADAAGKVTRRESVAQGEIVVGDDAPEADLTAADRLVKSLAKTGATVTITRASKRRCCKVETDSINAQFRIILGSATTNPLVAEAMNALDDKARAAVHAGGAFVFFLDPKAQDVPAVIITAPDSEVDLSFIGRLCGEIEKTRTLRAIDLAPGAADTKIAPVSAALINKGTPSYIVYDDGGGNYTIALSLLRSSSGWPSGLWLDPPRRKAPVGENFEFENWDHEFLYAYYPHEGAFYEKGDVRAGLEFNFPLIAVAQKAHGGALPASGAAFAQAGPQNVVMSAMTPDGKGGVSLRVFESDGRDVKAKVSLFRPFAGKVEQTNYLGEKKHGSITNAKDEATLTLGAFHTTTLSAPMIRKATAARKEKKASPLLSKEILTGAYARYWRYNIGAAPFGDMPVAVTLRPDVISIEPGQRKLEFSVVVSNEGNNARAKGRVKLVIPAGTMASGKLSYNLAPRSHAVLPVSVTLTAKEPPDSFVIRAEIDDQAVRGQKVYDVAAVSRKEKDAVRNSLNGNWDILTTPKNWEPGAKKRGPWMKVKVPGYWEDSLPPYDGDAIYRKEIEIPEAGGRPLELEFSNGIDDIGEIYLDGKRICPDAIMGPGMKSLCELGVLKPGKALLEIKVTDRGGKGGIGGDVFVRTQQEERYYYVELLTPEVEVKRGGKSVVKWLVRNKLGQRVKGEVLLISPPETWGWVPPVVPFEAPARGTVEVSVPVTVNGEAPVSNTWLLGKFMINGRLLYSEAADLRGAE